MAGKRIDLHDILLGIVPKAYYQPPESIKMSYPCIRYKLEGIKPENADNKLYLHKKRYTITLITFDAEPEEFNRILELPYCSFDRPYTSDGLHHFVFTIYY